MRKFKVKYYYLFVYDTVFNRTFNICNNTY